jgi:hypothetical protein
MSNCLVVCLSGCLYVWLSVCLFVSSASCLVVCMSVCLVVCLSVCLFVCLFVCLYVWLSVCLFVCLVVWLYICLSVWLSGCLYVWLSGCLLSGCLFVSSAGADHKGASRATATRIQLENPRWRLVPLSTVDLTSRRRNACDPSSNLTQRRRDAATTPRCRNDACDPSMCDFTSRPSTAVQLRPQIEFFKKIMSCQNDLSTKMTCQPTFLAHHDHVVIIIVLLLVGYTCSNNNQYQAKHQPVKKGCAATKDFNLYNKSISLRWDLQTINKRPSSFHSIVAVRRTYDNKQFHHQQKLVQQQRPNTVQAAYYEQPHGGNKQQTQTTYTFSVMLVSSSVMTVSATS